MIKGVQFVLAGWVLTPESDSVTQATAHRCASNGSDELDWKPLVYDCGLLSLPPGAQEQANDRNRTLKKKRRQKACWTDKWPVGSGWEANVILARCRVSFDVGDYAGGKGKKLLPESQTKDPSSSRFCLWQCNCPESVGFRGARASNVEWMENVWPGVMCDDPSVLTHKWKPGTSGGGMESVGTESLKMHL